MKIVKYTLNNDKIRYLMSTDNQLKLSVSNSEIKSLRLSERKIKCIKNLAFEIVNRNIDFNSYLYKAYKKSFLCDFKN